MEALSAQIIILLSELKGADCEWVRMDDGLALEMECIPRGLNEVEMGYLWDGVMAAWLK
jgi:hypothetical protein